MRKESIANLKFLDSQGLRGNVFDPVLFATKKKLKS